jgi:hypothetical protein
MRARDVDDDVVQLQISDLRDPRAAAAGQAHDHEITPNVWRAGSAQGQVGQDGSKFTAGEQTGLIQVLR